ncbi:MAG: hypothetical protein ABS85_11645 [Sphingobacteriales bacterium SCN 48-20]|jgi:hypothetical protein|uniref:hypothetical protein n=1 Tax=Terrimonas ferruginea TaxID=249 RepID=UPI00086C63DD|nr:hypothetical protein [Terrimonas ferruginea]MBN8783196.1 hypothetical protein [Terrimonas ferruginea]ODT91774.1 MAG: hypothetical protein ABS85_11645 [Sphingobacteriales bacterium SCN 48-20]OJW39817.1 MAG: hypothetical protein BGO56_02840 [Sphingobacteriales bacterium 48-107]
MENLNFHKRKLYALILAAAALLGLILPWFSIDFGPFGSTSANGFRSWGYLTLLGVIGVVIACFMGNKQSDFEGDMRKIAQGSFAAIAAGALIIFIRLLVEGGSIGLLGIGFWLSLAAGIVGTLWMLGRVKLPDIKKDDPTSPNNPPSNF